MSNELQSYIVEYVEYGYKRIFFSVEAQTAEEAEERVEAFDHDDPAVEVIESDFEVTGSEVVSVDPATTR